MRRTTITMDECGRIAVPSDAANVWMSEMELVTLFDVIAPPSEPCTKMECYNLAKWKGASGCPTAIMRKCMPYQWSWHSLSASTRPIPQGYATPCWKGCAREKKGKSCGSLWIAVTDTGVRLITANLTIVFC